MTAWSKGVLAGHVGVGTNFRGAPDDDLVGIAVPGSQSMALLILEDPQGQTPGGAVDPLSGEIPTPADRFHPAYPEAGDVVALEDVIPDILDTPLNVGLVLGVTHPDRVGDQSPVLRVVQETLASSEYSASAPATASGKLSIAPDVEVPHTEVRP